LTEFSTARLHTAQDRQLERKKRCGPLMGKREDAKNPETFS
jgi:hypothetical protein